MSADGPIRFGAKRGGGSGGMRVRRDDGAPKAEFNATSMTDVIFILLIFFVSLSEIRTSAEQIDLPSMTDEPEAIVDEREPAIVEITKDGRVLLDGASVEVGDMVAMLEAMRQRRGEEPRVRIRGDKEGNFGVFVEVTHALSRAGLERLEIEVQSRQGS